MPTIKDLRLEARLTKVELSQKSGVSTASISRIEKGEIAVRRLIALKVLDALSTKLNRRLDINQIESLMLAD